MKIGHSKAPGSTNPDDARFAVRVKNVSMDFGTELLAVDSVSFDLEMGRFLTILGPSGSGKTTLLRMIAGFQKPTSGDLTIGGKPVDAEPPHRRSVGMVFQKLALFPHMTAAENIAFPLQMRRFNPANIPVRVKQFLDLVKLGDYGDRRINVHQRPRHRQTPSPPQPARGLDHRRRARAAHRAG